jgi:hypothetical protein
MCIRFTDWPTHRVEGIADDVEVLIRNSHLVSDFVILNTGHDETTPIILGQPFLHTARATIYAGTSTIYFDIARKIEEFFKTHKPLSMSQGWCSHKNYRIAQALRALKPLQPEKHY